MTLYDSKIQELIERKDELLVPYRDSIMPDFNDLAEIDWEALQSAVTDIYNANDLPPPRFIRVESPWQAAVSVTLLELIKCGDEEWRSQLDQIFKGTLWHRAFEILKTHVGKKEHGITSDGARTVWLPQNVGSAKTNHVSYVLRCDKILRDSIDSGQFATLRSILHKRIEVLPPNTPTPEAIRLMRMMRPERQLTVYMYSLSENSRRMIVAAQPMGAAHHPVLEPSLERDIASFDRSLREGTLEAELIDLFPDEITLELPKKLRLSAQNSHLTYHESVEILAAHFAKVFCQCIMGIQWKFPREEWLALNTFPVDFLDKNFYDESLTRLLKAWPVLLKNNVPHVFLNNICFLIDKPVHSKLDIDGRLHCETGSAVEYKDGFKLYSWHSVTVPPNVVLEPESISVESIEQESNTEVRRVMIERYGDARYLEDSGAKLEQEDRYGQLYRKALPGEDFVVVKVKNSTPEADGSFHFYYIRVPPTMTSAHEAVAWTFNLSVEEYNPDIET